MAKNKWNAVDVVEGLQVLAGLNESNVEMLTAVENNRKEYAKVFRKLSGLVKRATAPVGTKTSAIGAKISNLLNMGDFSVATAPSSLSDTKQDLRDVRASLKAAAKLGVAMAADERALARAKEEVARENKKLKKAKKSEPVNSAGTDVPPASHTDSFGNPLG